ncbi:elongation factor-2 kinase-like protein [Leptomonas pyrrhocoris]|uniref:Elongation factor-2 kinase-like protein n=1 Tax=Leptomonas pyrrhocoris TaxID=157538 RepID=A0A0M9G3P0_LEPPY|nr:elongation factor-2 kinase-like protein [Leptomonas pyrrhocoris]KPA81509.1 elongation factor-2 kinase-like protein [Leptomonas pyrrhocoris]|eukprot:XP_015659948.1 elongation factor-2 kinase-like protein [Leptomonas pyrrhocoris]
MPSRALSSPSRPDKEPRSVSARQGQETNHEDVFASTRPAMFTWPPQNRHHAEFVTELAVKNGVESPTALAPQSGCSNESGSQLLSSSASRGTSPSCTPVATSLPTVQKVPKSNDVPAPRKKATRAEVALSRAGGGLIHKKAPAHSAVAAQPKKAGTSPGNTSLERRSSPSLQESSLAAVNKMKPLLKTASAADVTAKEAKLRTPSPKPLPPQKEHHTDPMTSSAAAAATAVATATHTPAAASLTLSPPLREPLMEDKVRINARSPAPQSGSAQAITKTWSPPMNTHESPDHLPTDAPNVVLPARKYIYDVKTCTWREVDTIIRVLHPNRGVSQGAMRVCFVVDDLDEEGAGTPMVAKMFRHNLEGIVEEDYFNEGEAQCMCGVFADKFNKAELAKGVDRFVISFLQCDTVRIRPRDLPEEYQKKRTGFFSYRTTDTRDIIFTMEPRLKGNFTKYTNNFGEVYEGFEQRLDNEMEQKRHKVLMAAEAFSHFTLQDSGGSMLVCDLQGVNDFLTDPQIHTEDGKGLGMGNMGQEGIDKWVEKHVCNDMCRALRLTPLKDLMHHLPKEPNVERRASYYKILRSNLRNQVPTLPEDLVPLPKPLSEMTDGERLDYAIRLSQLLS